ncbi:hypothetical protein DIPPA_29541 [Diplonema papillatum]|nr:hypothetical protein DIPPA_19272 [Diplonema papillatum]KAJ9473568.1 hypothetical protein DIPPA_29541 [Diplonema papillatum]
MELTVDKGSENDATEQVEEGVMELTLVEQLEAMGDTSTQQEPLSLTAVVADSSSGWGQFFSHRLVACLSTATTLVTWLNTVQEGLTCALYASVMAVHHLPPAAVSKDMLRECALEYGTTLETCATDGLGTTAVQAFAAKHRIGFLHSWELFRLCLGGSGRDRFEQNIVFLPSSRGPSGTGHYIYVYLPKNFALRMNPDLVKQMGLEATTGDKCVIDADTGIVTEFADLTGSSSCPAQPTATTPTDDAVSQLHTALTGKRKRRDCPAEAAMPPPPPQFNAIAPADQESNTLDGRSTRRADAARDHIADTTDASAGHQQHLTAMPRRELNADSVSSERLAALEATMATLANRVAELTESPLSRAAQPPATTPTANPSTSSSGPEGQTHTAPVSSRAAKRKRRDSPAAVPPPRRVSATDLTASSSSPAAQPHAASAVTTPAADPNTSSASQPHTVSVLCSREKLELWNSIQKLGKGVGYVNRELKVKYNAWKCLGRAERLEKLEVLKSEHDEAHQEEQNASAEAKNAFSALETAFMVLGKTRNAARAEAKKTLGTDREKKVLRMANSQNSMLKYLQPIHVVATEGRPSGTTPVGSDSESDESEIRFEDVLSEAASLPPDECSSEGTVGDAEGDVGDWPELEVEDRLLPEHRESIVRILFMLRGKLAEATAAYERYTQGFLGAGDVALSDGHAKMESLRKTVCGAFEGLLPPSAIDASLERDDDARGWGKHFSAVNSGVVAKAADNTISFLDRCCKKRDYRKRVQRTQLFDQAEAELDGTVGEEPTIWTSFNAKVGDVGSLKGYPTWEGTLSAVRVIAQSRKPCTLIAGLENYQVRNVLLHVHRNKSVVLDDLLQGFSRKQLVGFAVEFSALAPVLVLCMTHSVVINCASYLDVSDLTDELREPLPKLERRSAGRKKITEKYPALVDRIRLLLSGYSAQSHARRRESELKAGCTPTELHRLLEAEGFALSDSCLRRLFKAPNAGRKAASSYLDFFDVRLEGHEDTGRDDHVDDHFCRSQVRLVVEAAMFANASANLTTSGPRDEAMVLSVDAKCIVPLGAVAVNKNINTKTYYRVDPEGAADNQPRKPQVPDHSFVTGAGVKPVCVLELVPDPAELSLSRNNATGDARNRLHFPYPRNGPVRIFLRSTKYSRTNSQTNVNDTRVVLMERVCVPPVVCVISDNACDYAPSSMTTAFSLWRLFRDFRLDALVCVTYAAGHSAYNPVERAMSHLSKKLSGCTFGSAPKSTQHEDRKMHSTAMEAMSSRFTFDTERLTFKCTAVAPTDWAAPPEVRQKGRKSKKGAPSPPAVVLASVVASLMTTLASVVEKCDSPPSSIRAAVAACLAVAASAAAPVYDRRRRIYTDYEDLQRFLSSSRKVINDDPDLAAIMPEYRLMCRHMDRRKNIVIFRRCEGPNATRECAHCKSIPPLRAPFFLHRSMQETTSGLFYTPIPENEPDSAHASLHPASQHPAPPSQEDAHPFGESSGRSDAAELTQASGVDTDEDSGNENLEPQGTDEKDTDVPRPGERGHYLSFNQLRERVHFEVPTDFFRPSLKGNEHRWRCPTTNCKKLCLNDADVHRHYRLHHANLVSTTAATKSKLPLWRAHVRIAKQAPDTDKGREARLSLWTKPQLCGLARKASVELPNNVVGTEKGLVVSCLLAAWDRVVGLLQELEAQPDARFHVPKTDPADSQTQGQSQDSE